MEQLDLIQSFASKFGIKTKVYGRSVHLWPVCLGNERMSVHLVMEKDYSYTIVYQHEHKIDRASAGEAWDRTCSRNSNVLLTFGEINGLWKNRESKLRLFQRINIYDPDEFHTAVFSACEDLRNMREKLFHSMGHSMKKGSESAPKRGGFADVAGMEDIKHKIYDEIVWPLTNKAKATRYRITPPNGMLLYGPPGCGKTFFARKLAEETGFSFKMVYPSDIGSMLIHGTQGNVANLFSEAQGEAPCIICFDEIDAMIPRRSSTPGIEYQNSEVNEFLAQMNNCGEKGIFIIGTTNNIDLIDPAALRTGRLDYHIEIPNPDEVQRERIFRKCMEDRPAEKDIDYRALARMASWSSASDISFVVNNAALSAAKADAPISFQNLSDSLASVKSSRMTSSVAVPKPKETAHDDKPETAIQPDHKKQVCS